MRDKNPADSRIRRSAVVRPIRPKSPSELTSRRTTRPRRCGARPATMRRASPAQAMGNTVASSITGVTLSSDPGSDGTYAIRRSVRGDGDARFSGDGDRPARARLDGSPKAAIYESGSGTTKLVFSYEVFENDVDVDSVAIGADKLMLNGSSSKTGDVQAVLTHRGGVGVRFGVWRVDASSSVVGGCSATPGPGRSGRGEQDVKIGPRTSSTRPTWPRTSRRRWPTSRRPRFPRNGSRCGRTAFRISTYRSSSSSVRRRWR